MSETEWRGGRRQPGTRTSWLRATLSDELLRGATARDIGEAFLAEVRRLNPQQTWIDGAVTVTAPARLPAEYRLPEIVVKIEEQAEWQRAQHCRTVYLQADGFATDTQMSEAHSFLNAVLVAGLAARHDA